jgi:hypothetical protein
MGVSVATALKEQYTPKSRSQIFVKYSSPFSSNLLNRLRRIAVAASPGIHPPACYSELVRGCFAHRAPGSPFYFRYAKEKTK